MGSFGMMYSHGVGYGCHCRIVVVSETQVSAGTVAFALVVIEVVVEIAHFQHLAVKHENSWVST